MKISAIAMCLIGIYSNVGAQTTPPYNVSCTNENTATITVNKGFKLSADNQACVIAPNGGANTINLQLTSDCLAGTNLTVEPKTTAKDIHVVTLKEDRHVFTLTCEKKDGQVLTVTETLQSFNIIPTKEVVTFYPDNQLEILFVMKNPPKAETLVDLKARDQKPPAKLGDTIYLTIVDTSNTDKVIVPKRCGAKISTDTKADTPLWELKQDTQCINEPSVVRSSFKMDKTAENTIISYLEIKAFKFTNKETADIIFSCDVRVCEKEANCHEDKGVLENCQKTPGIRHRREANVATTSHSRIHQVTGRLRVVSDVIELGIDGSTNITYTLPCLLMALLAKFIL